MIIERKEKDINIIVAREKFKRKNYNNGWYSGMATVTENWQWRVNHSLSLMSMGAFASMSFQWNG